MDITNRFVCPLSHEGVKLCLSSILMDWIAVHQQQYPEGNEFDRLIHRIALRGPIASGKSHMLQDILADVQKRKLPFGIHVEFLSLADMYSFQFSDGSAGFLSGYFDMATKRKHCRTILVLDHAEVVFPKTQRFTSDDFPLTVATFATLQDSSEVEPMILESATDVVLDVSPPTCLERIDLMKSMLGERDHFGLVEYIAGKMGGFQLGDVVAVAGILKPILRKQQNSLLHGSTSTTNDEEEDDVPLSLVQEDLLRNFLDFPKDRRFSQVTHYADDVRASFRRNLGQLFHEVKSYQPLQGSVGFVDVTETKWSDIVGLEKEKELLQQLLLPYKKRDIYLRNKISPKIGVLLYGIPGTGKTMLAKAVATEMEAAFLYLDIPQLVQSEVGESERILDEFFQTARARAPCVVFFDELQAAFVSSSQRQASVHDTRLTAQLISKFDECRRMFFSYPVVVIGATNCPEQLDPQLLRSGRLDTHLHIPPPDRCNREVLIHSVLKRKWLAGATSNIDGHEVQIIAQLVDRSDGYSGADVSNLMNIFALEVLKKHQFAKDALFSALADGNLQTELDTAFQRCCCGDLTRKSVAFLLRWKFSE